MSLRSHIRTASASQSARPATRPNVRISRDDWAVFVFTGEASPPFDGTDWLVASALMKLLQFAHTVTLCPSIFTSYFDVFSGRPQSSHDTASDMNFSRLMKHSLSTHIVYHGNCIITAKYHSGSAKPTRGECRTMSWYSTKHDRTVAKHGLVNRTPVVLNLDFGEALPVFPGVHRAE